jgi:uncharacterized linocin/CFP29 family protein
MNHLLREVAPISERAWEEIDREAATTLKHFLAGRRLLDFEGPKGWDHIGEATGRVDALGSLQGGAVSASARRSQPMLELRTTFEVSRRELEAIDRGSCDADLDSVREAAKRAALAEDELVFHGFPAGAVQGLVGATPLDPVPITTDYERYPRYVAQAMARLQDVGVDGPFAIALGPRCYTGVIEESEMGGYPVLEHLRLILGGPVVRAQAVDGAVVMSIRGGDFQIVTGQDFSIGYLSHDRDTVSLYLEETITVRICLPEAAVHLRYPD